MIEFERSLKFAKELDLMDPLAKFRAMFHYPNSIIYFCGNSLGLQPKTARTEIDRILKTWEEIGVEGWFHGSKNWFSYSDDLVNSLARIIGAHPEEVSIMNSLTVNLHLLLVSFYRPTSDRHRILIEEHAFPSDQYALKSQIRFHGYDVNDSLLEVKARAGEHTLRTEDIIEAIDESIALVLFSGINYLTGQAFDMEAITKAAHAKGAAVGFDLAHAVGNIPLELHDWNVDFAVWCNYKYLNAGPGGISACFIHKNNFEKDLPRFDGWWGGERETMFLMEPDINPALGASGWQISTHPVLLLASLKAALDVWDKLEDLSLFYKKRDLLTGYLEFLIKELGPENYEIITPSKANERGCQLSIRTLKNGKKLFNTLIDRGVTVDWREPDIIRVAPNPLYNTFEEVFLFAEILAEAVQ
ncbi:kynureninase [Candidatus Borrarchaeum sp.]|uniref:kynureninase n=1 Tax=Candidatus Borrarchaeum sp. TaxID=2846742 RepID=UPI00257C0001|nr:kynureninase [Candidatus Borrarchaeum sp.]